MTEPIKPDDETTESQRSGPRDIIRQAHDDATSGQQDTDRAPLTDDLYERQVRPEDDATRDRDAPKADRR